VRHCLAVRFFPIFGNGFEALTRHSLNFRIGAAGLGKFDACALPEAVETVTICVVIVLFRSNGKRLAPRPE
jgi:hypothetical protein